MSFAHWRTRGRLGLLASGALEGAELEAVRAHVSECATCASELARMRLVLEQVALDPVRTSEPEIDMALLVRRTLLRLDGAPQRERERAHPWRLLVPLASAAALAIVVVALRNDPARVEPPPVPAAQQVSLPEESLRRMERAEEREQAARYLDEAEAVLVTVAAAPQHCDKSKTTVDLTTERKRSRELLQRRALLVDLDSEEIRSARRVLEDVEHVLQQVARLDACARPEDLIAIHEELRDRRLLMKIDLMTKELLG